MWKPLLDSDPNVRRWHDNLANSSTGTAENYLYKLGAACRALGLSPEELAALPPEKRDDLIFDFIQAEANRPPRGGARGSKQSGGTLKYYRNALASWLAWRRCQPMRRFKIPNAHVHPNLDKAKLPIQ